MNKVSLYQTDFVPSGIWFPKTISNQFRLDLNRHNSQYPAVNVEERNNIHDRFLIIDETVYHIGASLKDLGKKLFAFSKMELSSESIFGMI